MIRNAQIEVCCNLGRQLPRADQQRFHMRVMTACLMRSRIKLAPVAAASLDTAVRHWWNREGTEASLTDARVACWKHLDAIGESTSLATSEVAGVRAVICTLYGDSGEDDEFLEQTTAWFATVLDQLGDHSEAFQHALESASVREYKAMVWDKPDEPGKRVAVWAVNGEEARRLLADQYGASNVFDIHNEADANRPR